MDNRHSAIKAAHAKTCQWLAKHPDYAAWLDPSKFASHHGVLWISGKPGAGKSTIMKYVFAQAKRKSARNKAVLSFFFNARGERLEKTTEGMHRSILVQLLEKLPELQKVLEDSDLPPLPQPPYNPHSWNLSLLREIFSRAISKLEQQQVTCFIDALDECAEDEVRQMLDFFEDVGQCAVQNGIHFYVCFSSRHYPHIEIQFGVRFTLEDQSGHASDLEEYVRSRLRTGTTKHTEEITAEILQKASGVFMWVVLVIDILNKEFQRGRIFGVRKRLSEIPRELSDLFMDILKRDRENMDDLLLAIQWILFGQRPLRLEEYYFALVAGLDPRSLAEWDAEHITEEIMDNFVVSSSKGLAETTRSKNSTSTIQFIHESVRDFLLKDNGLASLWPHLGENPEGKCHERLRKCCLAYTGVNISSYTHKVAPLNTSSEAAKALRTQVAEKFPFLEYATKQVLYHANIAAGLAVAQDHFVQELAAALQDWIQLNNLFEPFKIRRYTKNASLLYIVVDYSLANLIEPVVRHCPRSKGPLKERYKTLLSAAVHSNNPETVRALLPRLERHEIDEPAEGGRTALWAAVKRGRPEVVEMILSAGANPEAPDNRGLIPIISAIQQGNERVVEMLLTAGANPNTLPNGHLPLIYCAIMQGNEGITKTLLNAGADLNAHTHSGLPLIFFAIRQGNTRMVKALLDAGVDPNASHGDTLPIFSAIEQGNIGIVKTLLNAGADHNAYSYHGLPLIFSAVEQDNAGMVQALLDAGADPNTYGHHDTPLIFSVVMQGNEDIVKQLLFREYSVKEPQDISSRLPGKAFRGNDCRIRGRSEVNVNWQDERGFTALHYVLEHENLALAKLLLNAGADVNSCGVNSAPPLDHLIHHIRVERKARKAKVESPEHMNILSLFQLLLEKGAKVNDEHGLSVVEAAIQLGDAAVIRTFLDAGAFIFSFGKHDLNHLLRQAVRRGNREVCKFLLEEGADVNGTDTEGYPILMTAFQAQDLSVFELLIESGADIKQISKNDLDTALGQTVRNRNKYGCKLLIGKGADANAIDEEGHSILRTAVQAGDVSLFEILVDAGANINQISEDDLQTALNQAVLGRNNRICRLLLAAGADVNFRPKGFEDRPVLHRAAWNGDIDVVETLLGRGAEVNCTDFLGKTPLHFACDTDATAVTTALVLKGAKIQMTDGKGRSPMNWAIRSARPEQVQCLLQLGADVNERNQLGNTPLFEACERNAVECGKLLIKGGADVTVVNNVGENALFRVRGGLLKPMIEAGADPLHRNYSGRLFFEKGYKNDDFFLELGCFLIGPDLEASETVLATNAFKKLVENVPIRDDTGGRLLGTAAGSQNSELVRFLVHRGIDPNYPGHRSYTPLLQAIRSHESDDQVNTVLFLLDNGAHANMPDWAGETPLQLSIRLGRKRVEEVLRSRIGPEACLPPRASSDF